MSYIRQNKTGTTQLCIPDPLPLSDDVTASLDFFEGDAQRARVPSAGAVFPPVVGLHIKHNHAALASTNNTTHCRRLTDSDGVSLLKRPNQMKTVYAQSSSKIPRTAAPSMSDAHLSTELMAMNDAMLNRTESVSKMSSLLTTKGLTTPNKHVRDVPADRCSSNLYACEKPSSVNVYWLPHATNHSITNRNSTKQMPVQSKPILSISNLEQNASALCRQYSIGQSTYRASENAHYKPTSTQTALPPISSMRINQLSRAHPQHILVPVKPVMPVHLVRNLFNPKQCMIESDLPCDFSLTKVASHIHPIPEMCKPDYKTMNTNTDVTNTHLTARKQDTSVVRCISFEGESETERLTNDIGWDDTAGLGNELGTVKKENLLELCDHLKNIKAYVISGWMSTTYLQVVMQKPNTVNEMFDNALDIVGDIRDEVVKNCYRDTPAVLARDLVFRLFTLEELNLNDLKRLSKNKMSAIRRCLKKHFPDFDRRNWVKKCIPQIKSSLLQLFEHNVKPLQELWLTQSIIQQLDSSSSA